ncbi:MAG TPA: hypothetical protein VFU90_10545, partial [Candidatus Tumulicola sp.]|nr:hypothetical protein [Candidatus Tumulicola sp.]
MALRGEGRLDDELACYDDVVAQFGYARPAEIVTQVALALLNKGVALGSHRMHERAIVAYNEVVRRFGERSESSLREH